MKTGAAVLFAIVASASAFTGPLMATRAIKKPAAKAAPAAPAAPSSSYPVWEGAQKIQFPGISGGGNKAPTSKWTPPDFSDPKLQIERDPAFYAAAAKTRLTKNAEFVFEDGLTAIERTQRKTIPMFLSGSARSQVDKSAIVGEIDGVDYFGLSADRFQLLFISVFGIFTLVGCLSGNLKL